MDGSSLLALPTSPPSGLQIFALFVNFFFPTLALLVVSLRAAGRVAANQLALDDWLVCIAMLMSIAETVISFFFIRTNFVGIPPEQVPVHDPTQALIWTYAVQILYNPILALVKSSVLIFLTRLFGQRDGVRRFLFWLNVANVSQMVAVFFAIVLQCFPVAFNWDPTIKGGRCVDRPALYVSTSAFNIATDFLILGLPLWIFSSLKLPKRTKAPLLVVFLLGFLATMASIIRLILLIQGLYGISIFPNASSNNIGFVTSAIETNLALITASAPALRPIFRSRDRGGWFARTMMPTINPNGATTAQPDLEAGGKLPPSIGWDSSTSGDGSPTAAAAAGRDSAPVLGSKFGRGGSRGGRKGGSTARTRRKGNRTSSGSTIKPVITRVRTAAELRSSPRSSEEQAMTYNGIVRVSDIQREIDGIVKDIAVAGAGSYTGRSRRAPAKITTTFPTTTTTPTPNKTPPTARTAPQTNPPPTRPKTPKTPTSATTRPQPRPSMESITIGDTTVTPLPRRPSTSGNGAARRPPPERYYSASIYPEQGIGKEVEEEEDEKEVRDARVSRYGGERRFGVVTPKGTTPTSRGWEGSGRPF